MRPASRTAPGRDVAGIHEQRFAGRRDEERGVAAFDVDDVDVEGRANLAAFPLRMRAGKRARQEQGQSEKQEMTSQGNLRRSRILQMPPDRNDGVSFHFVQLVIQLGARLCPGREGVKFAECPGMPGKCGAQTQRRVSSEISGGTPRRMGAPMVPKPRLT